MFENKMEKMDFFVFVEQFPESEFLLQQMFHIKDHSIEYIQWSLF